MRVRLVRTPLRPQRYHDRCCRRAGRLLRSAVLRCTAPHRADTTRRVGPGARDAWLTPITMKKGRPAFTLSALCDADLKLPIATVFLEDTTTLGVRISEVTPCLLP